MNIYLYSIAKYENSTKIPATTPNPVAAVLKEPCDILHPVFTLSRSNVPDGTNYLKCTLHGKARYYTAKVRYITYDIVELSCDVDSLASWRSEINNSTQYIERCSDLNHYTDLSRFLNDVAAPAVVAAYSAKIDEWDLFDPVDGYFILGLNAKGISNPIAVRGSVSYVAMSKSDLSGFIADLFSLQGELGDLAPIQYIVSCVYIPITYDGADFYLETGDTINLGGASTYQLSFHYRRYLLPADNQANGLKGYSNDITIPNHPEFNGYNYYLNYPPYSKVHVVGSVFGDFDLPIGMLNNKLRYDITIDVTDGSGLLEICNQYDESALVPIYKQTYVRLTAQIGVPVALAQSVSATTADKYKVYSSIAESLGSALTLNVGGSIAAMGSALMNAYEGNIPTVTTSGSNGSVAALAPIFTYHITNDILNDDIYHVGKPIYKSKALSSIAQGSFVKVRNPLISITGLAEERDAILTYMANGFYLE